MRNNNFKIGERVKALITDSDDPITRPYKGIIENIHGGAVLIKCDNCASRWVNYRNCIRLKKPKPIIISIEKYALEGLIAVPGMAMLPVHIAILPNINLAASHFPHYYDFKCIRRPKRD